MSRARVLTAGVVISLCVALVPVATSVASTPRARIPAVRITDVGPDLLDGKVPFDVARVAPTRLSATSAPTRIGATHKWIGYDETRGAYLKEYRLRGRGRHVEVWVAADEDHISRGIRFPDGDCRNDERVKITNAQVDYFVRQFSRNIYPKESRFFSVPPRRNGSDATLPGRVGLPEGYFRGEGDNIVVLVDNVRDDNFYDTDNAQNKTYIAGFFASDFNELLDRNVMTVDAFDWLHRTRANPPNEPAPGDLCLNKSARPFLYEGVFAHEYQHLLEYYQDPTETPWVNEGLSDWAQTLTGYVNPRLPVSEIGFDSHTQCFLGYLGIQTPANPLPRGGGPENSLTAWSDQGDDEILCDYGAAYTLMELLRNDYGKAFMTKLHRFDTDGLRGLNRVLRTTDTGDTARDVLHRWAAAVALDGILDRGAVLHGGVPADLRVPTLDATINWDTAEAYASPGAPPNGADYVRLREPNGGYINSADIRKIEFDGAEHLAPVPVEWTVDLTPPGQTGDPAYFSGNDDNLDNAMVRRVTVPQDDATLTFNTRFSVEEYYDYGYVEVSTDGGETYEKLSNNHTVPDSVGEPSFTGNSGCPDGSQVTGDCTPRWVEETFDLSRYAGQEIVIGFRFVSDVVGSAGGWWVDDVAVGGAGLGDGSTLAGWSSPSAIHPVEVAGFTVMLVAYTPGQNAYLTTLPLGEGFTATLEGDALSAALGTGSEVVAAIVMYDEGTETIVEYAQYELRVDGKLQPGGA